MTLKASFLVVVFLMGVLAPAIAQTRQNKKPRKKLKELLMMADSLRLQLRQSADRKCNDFRRGWRTAAHMECCQP